MKKFILITLLLLVLTACGNADITKSYTITDIEFVEIDAKTASVKKSRFNGQYFISENHWEQIGEIMRVSKNLDTEMKFDIVIGDDKILAISPSENRR